MVIQTKQTNVSYKIGINLLFWLMLYLSIGFVLVLVIKLITDFEYWYAFLPAILLLPFIMCRAKVHKNVIHSCGNKNCNAFVRRHTGMNCMYRTTLKGKKNGINFGAGLQIGGL